MQGGRFLKKLPCARPIGNFELQRIEAKIELKRIPQLLAEGYWR